MHSIDILNNAISIGLIKKTDIKLATIKFIVNGKCVHKSKVNPLIETDAYIIVDNLIFEFDSGAKECLIQSEIKIKSVKYSDGQIIKSDDSHAVNRCINIFRTIPRTIRNVLLSKQFILDYVKSLNNNKEDI